MWQSARMSALSGRVELADGRRAAYEVIGAGDPLFYFQGGPGLSAALLRADAELLADSFAVHLIEPHGSGGSTPPRERSQYDHIGHARFYDDVRQALGVERAMIMGISFGAIVALTYAALFPEACEACIAVAGRAVGVELESEDAAAEMQRFLGRHAGASWYPSARAVWDEWTERVLAAQDPAAVDAMMAEVLPLYMADPERPGARELIEAFRRDGRTDLEAAKAWESGLWQTIDVRPLLTEIGCPTMLLVGELDLICGPSQARLIAASIPQAEMVIVEDCGHFVGAEAPEQFRGAVLDFHERHSDR
jgi:pimeloyl-ACP methyl ester carboxylesterase